MKHYFFLCLSNIFIDNFILVKFLGLCPFMGVSNNIQSAVGMSLATSFVIIISSFFLWFINGFILIPYDLLYLRIILYILIISVLVQFLELFLKKISFRLYLMLGIFLPLITTNCAVLAIPLFNIYLHHTLIESILYGVSASLGYTLVMIIFSSIRERIIVSDIPLIFKGAPIALINISLMSITFMGFQGIIKL
ncbi:electron transport complex subunit RsxA [Buchnera aphidicola]|uniref:electron transport complex subunit RsxA n=1 Tax=Buchnera aphidicola TaxID=9 RepID=UPI0034644CBA